MDAQPRKSTPRRTEIEERQRKAWSSGNYARQGAHLLIIAELLCEAVELRPGSRVLDVATGTGNAALAAARRFCEVTGVDRNPDSLEQARKRTAAEGFRIDFRQGAAEDLPFPDSSFEFVLSSIGAMFAPDQQKVAGELLRVCRPGGKIGLANWTPDSFVGELSRTIDGYVTSPADLGSAFLWGTERRLRELIGEGVRPLKALRRSFVFRYPSPQLYVEYTQTHYGTLVKVLEELDADGQKELVAKVEDLVRRFDRSDDETMAVPIDYLEVVAERR